MHGHRENLEMIDAIWYVLMYYFDQIKSKKSTIIYYKNIDYSYTPGYTIAISYFAPRVKTYSYRTSRDYFAPPPKLLEKKWTIYLLYLYVHFQRVFVEFVVFLTKIWSKNIDFIVLFLPPPFHTKK